MAQSFRSWDKQGSYHTSWGKDDLWIAQKIWQQVGWNCQTTTRKVSYKMIQESLMNKLTYALLGQTIALKIITTQLCANILEG